MTTMSSKYKNTKFKFWKYFEACNIRSKNRLCFLFFLLFYDQAFIWFLSRLTVYSAVFFHIIPSPWNYLEFKFKLTFIFLMLMYVNIGMMKSRGRKQELPFVSSVPTWLQQLRLSYIKVRSLALYLWCQRRLLLLS